jgi:UDP-N-acetylmuramate: L-alanyl-gamma-D-glutamyl-meso-diaminopimelate ligase
MKVHFIAVGGAVMHNLALALKMKGYDVTGSDDEIFEPSRSRLAAAGILPEKDGWYPEKLTGDIDTVILGMHARADNPELIAANRMRLKVVSFPEYIYEQTRGKLRIVVGGSHGKTTTTAMIMHVFRYNNIPFDYLVGSAIDGYETMVGLSDDSKTAVIEGDEYLTSPVDRRPKFHLYKPHIAIINGIAWDHMNVFPTFENYCEQFSVFASTIMPGGALLYYANDPEAVKIAEHSRNDIRKVPYDIHGYMVNKTGCYAVTINRMVRVGFFGAHNMQNLSAAREACLAAGLTEDQFYNAIGSFPGSAKRLQLLASSGGRIVYLDFAHAPSKVKATVEAVKEQYPSKSIVAMLELHTYSSLNADFLSQYRGTLDSADRAFVYFNPHALAMKKLPPLSRETVREAFGSLEVTVSDNSSELLRMVKDVEGSDVVFLIMSSGDFNGTGMQLFAEELVI